MEGMLLCSWFRVPQHPAQPRQLFSARLRFVTNQAGGGGRGEVVYSCGLSSSGDTCGPLSQPPPPPTPEYRTCCASRLWSPVVARRSGGVGTDATTGAVLTSLLPPAEPGLGWDSSSPTPPPPTPAGLSWFFARVLLVLPPPLASPLENQFDRFEWKKQKSRYGFLCNIFFAVICKKDHDRFCNAG